MAAPAKQGIDYYPFCVGLLKDRKFRPLRLKYGSVVGTIYLALLDLIYSDKGYYVEYGENKDNVVWDVMEYLQGKFQPDAETVCDVIDGLVSCELFSGEHYPKIITSRRVQETYYRATVDRKAVEIEFDVWLLTVEEMSEISTKSPILAKIINRTKNGVNRANNSVNGTNNPQSRVEKSRVEKRDIAPRRFSPAQERFRAAFPGKALDAEFPEDLNAERFIEKIRESRFLSENDNLGLSWCLKKREEILAGKYRDYRKSSGQNFEQREYGREELDSYFANED